MSITMSSTPVQLTDLILIITLLCLCSTTMKSTIGRIILPFADLAPLPLSASLLYLVATNPKKLAAAAGLLLDFWWVH